MRTVPIHWLLLVCFLATPLSHGQATEAVAMSPHEIALAFANWTGTPQLVRREGVRATVRKIFPGKAPAQNSFVASLPLPNSTALPPRPSETPTAQPAGP
jgi:hypothetical protein